MRLPRRQSRDRAPASEIMDSALTAFAVVLLIASLGGVMGLLSTLHIGLRVGDILVFQPDAPHTGDVVITADRVTPLPARAPATCNLDPAFMTSGHGGSLVVESKATDESKYVVHWSGTRTSAAATDCGRTADLTMSRLELQSLVNVVGGFSLNSHGNVL